MESPVSNGKTNGKANGNGHTNGNGPYYRTKADCFIAYREGRSLRWIAEHCQWGRARVSEWHRDEDWDKQVDELDAERVRLHETATTQFETKFISDLQRVIGKILAAVEKRIDKKGQAYTKDVIQLVKAYEAMRRLNAGSAGTGGGGIEQRVTVSLDPDEDGDE